MLPVIVASGLLSSVCLHAQYTFTTFSVPGSNGSTQPLAINQAGDVVGTSGAEVTSAGATAFLYSNGIFTILNGAQANGIDTAGAVLGTYLVNGIQQTYLYSGGTYTQILPHGDTSANAIAISSGGTVLGMWVQSLTSGFFTYSAGTYNINNYVPGVPLGINNSGQIVGYMPTDTGSNTGYIYSNGVTTTPASPPGYFITQINAINDSGQYVGVYTNYSTGASQGFSYQNGVFETLNVPGANSFYGAVPTGINNNGAITGSYTPASEFPGSIAGFIATLPVAPSVPAASQVVNESTGACLTVDGNSKAFGAYIGQSACWGGSDQIWRFSPLSNGNYPVTSLNSLQVLDIAGSSKTAGAFAVQDKSASLTSQQWTLQPQSDGSFTLMNANSGLCLDGFESNVSSGLPAQQQTCSGDAAPSTQNWNLLPLSKTTSVNLSAAYNVNAISVNGTVTVNGGLDGEGNVYSESTLRSGYNWDGYSFSFGPANAPDAVSSVKINLPSGQYNGVYLLGTAVNGAQPFQPFTVYYSDGTTDAVEQSLNDWLDNSPALFPGESIALTVPYGLRWYGAIDGQKFNVYGFQIRLNSAKTAVALALPNNRDVVLLAITLGK